MQAATTTTPPSRIQSPAHRHRVTEKQLGLLLYFLSILLTQNFLISCEVNLFLVYTCGPRIVYVYVCVGRQRVIGVRIYRPTHYGCLSLFTNIFNKKSLEIIDFGEWALRGPVGLEGGSYNVPGNRKL